MSPGRATPEQVLTAVQVELALIVKRLIACRNRIYGIPERTRISGGGET